MRIFMLVAMLIALLVTAYLVHRDVTSRLSKKEGRATITTIERAKQVEKKVQEAGEAAQKRLEDILKE